MFYSFQNSFIRLNCKQWTINYGNVGWCYTTMSTSFRWIVVDDTDSKIRYNGPRWSFSEPGNNNFANTLHSTQQNASLSFAFNGHGVIVYGVMPYGRFTQKLTVDCFVDNVRIDSKSFIISGSSGQNWGFCQKAFLPDGPHILTVNFTVPADLTVMFDSIGYIPSASVPLDHETIIVPFDDPQLQYEQGWNLVYEGVATSVSGSMLTFNFTGISLSWYGESSYGNSSQATYSIDGQTPINFELTGVPGTDFNYKFFQTALLPAGPHTLKVVYQGDNNSAPLHLRNFLIQNGTLPSTATSTTPHMTTAIATTVAATIGNATTSHNASTTSNAATTTSNTVTGHGVSGTFTPSPVGTIVGGVIGGLTLIILGLLLLICRHKRHAAKEKVPSSTPRPFGHPSSTTPNYTLPLQQSTLTIRKPLLSPLPVSRPSQLPLLNRTERKAEALAASESRQRDNALPAMASVQRNDIRSPNDIAHEDSGIRMPPSTPATNVTTEFPPLYTVE